ncbi:hypothetical protein J3F83DRAFT_428098 [Trichoderma novae-zelandiae]
MFWAFIFAFQHGRRLKPERATIGCMCPGMNHYFVPACYLRGMHIIGSPSFDLLSAAQSAAYVHAPPACAYNRPVGSRGLGFSAHEFGGRTKNIKFLSTTAISLSATTSYDRGPAGMSLLISGRTRSWKPLFGLQLHRAQHLKRKKKAYHDHISPRHLPLQRLAEPGYRLYCVCVPVTACLTTDGPQVHAATPTPGRHSTSFVVFPFMRQQVWSV